MTEIKKQGKYEYIITKRGNMLTDAVIFASENMLRHILSDKAHLQIINVAALKGIVGPAVVMPDIHYGYGFPIGGVAAFSTEEGIISPGGIGYDINCGVRLMRLNINFSDISSRDIEQFLSLMYNKIPSGVGGQGTLKLGRKNIEGVLTEGGCWAVKEGYGLDSDTENTEEGGCLEGADPAEVSQRAKERGLTQLGTLGAGNHFLEIQHVSEIYDEQSSSDYGIRRGQMTVMIHSGSRGLGFQVCEDYLKVMRSASARYGIKLQDRQLACAPLRSPEGNKYFKAMQCAANYAWANRQVMAHRVRLCAKAVFGSSTSVDQVYDVCHNVGKIEKQKGRELLVHRKGATRAFGPGRKEIPERYRRAGQPVIVPGTMGTSSFLMKGTEKAMDMSFGSTAHGAGRMWSRSQALRNLRGGAVKKELDDKGIFLMAKSFKTVAEEAPQAYKDISEVVQVCHGAGLSGKVARLLPVAVMKG